MKKIIMFFICIAFFCNNLYCITIPEGIEFSSIILKDRWDMQNTDDIYPLKWAINLKSYNFENATFTGVTMIMIHFFGSCFLEL